MERIEIIVERFESCIRSLRGGLGGTDAEVELLVAPPPSFNRRRRLRRLAPWQLKRAVRRQALHRTRYVCNRLPRAALRALQQLPHAGDHVLGLKRLDEDAVAPAGLRARLVPRLDPARH